MVKFLSNFRRLLRWETIGILILFCGSPNPANSASITADFQERVVRGRVTSADDGVGFPGVNVLVKGSTRGTVTDADGNYSIEVSTADAVLVFSSIGYKSTEVAAGTQSTLDIALEVDITTLSEVVVIGYGTVKKSDVTGALSRVTAETIQERPVLNALQALQGKAAGMHISSNYKPGELPAVSIRGNRSFGEAGATNDPLYVVDGIPLSTILGVSAFTMNDLSPNDIASVEILKDASATAIYGSRAANGVILITTKKGAQGKIGVSYNSTVSLDSYKSLTDWMNGGEYVDRWRLSLMNGGLYSTAQFTDRLTPVVPGYPDPNQDIIRMGLASDLKAQESVLMGYEWVDGVVGGTVLMRPTTAEEQAMGWPAEVPAYNSKNVRSYDWLNDAVRQGITQNHQVSLNAGNDKSRMYVSLGYLNQLGVQKDQDFRRYNATLTGDITANEWLTLGTSFIGSFSQQNFGILPPNTSNTGSKDLFGRASDQFPYALPKDDNGNWIRNPGGNLGLFNPLIDIDQAKNERRTAAILANMFTELKFTPWLKYRVNFGAQYRNFRRGSWTGPLATNHLTNRPSTAGYNNEEHFSSVIENLLFFDKTIAGDHVLRVTLLQSAQKSRRENIQANVSSTIYDVSYWYDLAANTVGRPDGYGSGFTQNSLMSYMGRVNYTFKDKYLLTASGRYDGASVLAPGHKWDFFPSFALAWKMHEETFLSGFSWIDELKPRFGYGVVGNSSVPPYTAAGPLSRNPYVFGSVPAVGYLPQLVQNPDLGWEKTTQLNVGLDFSIFEGRLSGAIEYYESNTSDIILRRTLPALSGYVEKYENVGKTRNRGTEITLSSVNIERGDFSWSTDVNWFANKEEIVELINGKEDMLAQRWFIGEPIQVFYQYENDGIWQNTAEDLEEMAKFNAAAPAGGGHRFYPGTIKVVDQPTVDTDGDGAPDAGDYRINADDYVVLGNNRPKWTGGITNTFKYKNWTLSSFVYARVGQTYFGGYPNSYGGTFPNGRVENDVWSFDNPGGRWPMPTTGTVDNFTSAMQYNDGSFVSVRNISLAYAFPKAWLHRISVNDVELNFQVMNPFMFGGDVVKWGLNPDDDTNWSIASTNTNPLGGTNNNTVLQQSWVFGLRVGF